MKLLPRFGDGRIRWRRILIWSGIGLGIVGIYAFFFGIATMFVVESRSLARDNPPIWRTPVELTNSSISTAPGKKLSYFGYEFEVPWTDLDEKITRPIGQWQFVAFHSGKAITLSRLPPKELVNSFLFTKGEVEFDARMVRRLYGDNAVDSDYGFTSAVLQTTPGQITLLTPRPDIVRRVMQLTFKSIFTSVNSGASSGIYFLRTKNFRGFQYGDPRTRPHEIAVYLFGDSGAVEIRFEETKSAANFSQEEINSVVQTVRAVRP